MDMTIILAVASLGIMALVLGAGLGFAGKIFAVEEDERIALVRDALPGANCGGCGFAGCDAYAAAVVAGEASPGGCPVGGSVCGAKVAEIMGVAAETGQRKAAFVKCGGDCDKAKNRYDYVCIDDCRAAAMLPGGGAKGCGYGCLGSGSCVKACQFGAISVVNGIAVVDEDKCTSCGMCVKACPRNLIEIVPVNSQYRVACSSKDIGKVVRTACSAGCIACKMCERQCQYNAVHVVDNIANIDYNKCVQCGACATKCPTKVITAPVTEVNEAEAV